MTNALFNQNIHHGCALVPCHRRAHLVRLLRFLGISSTRSAHHIAMCAPSRALETNSCFTTDKASNASRETTLDQPATRFGSKGLPDPCDVVRLNAAHRCGKNRAAILGCYASTGSFLGKAFLASRQTSDATTVLQSIRLSTVLFAAGLVVCAAHTRTAKTLALSKQTTDCDGRFK